MRQGIFEATMINADVSLAGSEPPGYAIALNSVYTPGVTSQ